MPVEVAFQYDESTRKWEVVVRGVESKLEAKQAFNAVAITLREAILDCGLLHKVVQLPSGDYSLEPAVYGKEQQ